MTNLMRDPADWARQWGWVSGIRAERAAARLENLERAMLGATEDDEVVEMWAKELRSVAAYLRKDTYTKRSKAVS